MTVEDGYAPTKPCVGCTRMLPLYCFPLAQPRADGSRHPYRFCEDCHRQRSRPGIVSAEEKRAVHAASKRPSRFRRRLQRGHW